MKSKIGFQDRRVLGTAESGGADSGRGAPPSDMYKLLIQKSIEDEENLQNMRKLSQYTKPVEPKSKHHRIFGKFPAKPVEVELKLDQDPKDMICGMGEFFFSEGMQKQPGKKDSQPQHHFLPDEYFKHST